MRVRKLLDDKRGTSAIEYAFVAVLISTACIGGYAALGSQSKTGWQGVWEKYRDAIGY
jgi:Flp pilus assembly pilin Flp